MVRHAGEGRLGQRPGAEAFTDFYRREWRGAVRLASVVTGSVAAGEDVAQDVFQRMWLHWGAADDPRSYLRVAIVNTARSWHRRRRRERERLPRLVRVDVGPPEPERLDDIVRGLPHRQQVVIVLRYWHDLSETEIAELLDCAPGTVKSLASRARRRVASAVAP